MLDDDKKTRYWGEERNARRRELYRTNKEYREAARQNTRETYRKNREAAGVIVRDDECAESIPILDTIGDTRTITKNGDTTLTLTVEEMARALNRNQQVLYRWFANDMLPRPIVTASTGGNRTQLVYTEVEAVAILTGFSEHQKHSQYYRERHDDTRENIRSLVETARADLAARGIL